MAALFGADDHVAEAHVQARRLVGEAARVRVVAADRRARAAPSARRLDRLLAIKAEGEVTRALMQARCDRGAEIALMLGLSPRRPRRSARSTSTGTAAAQPRGLRGEEIPLLGRILCLAQTAELFHAAGGVRAAWRVARRRRGGWFDPALVDAFGTLLRDDRLLGRPARR